MCYLVIGLSVVLTLVVLLLVYHYFGVKRKTAMQLAEQKTSIAALKKSNADKLRLLSIIAHDLVNPFNAILGYTKLLETNYHSFSEAERMHFVKIINTNATSNYKLTQNLLDWVRIQRDGFTVKKTDLNVADLIKQAIEPYLILAHKKQIEVKTNIPNGFTITADQNITQIVIGNVFFNAIKFTEENGRVNINTTKTDKGQVEITIEDNGIGMAQEQLQGLFNIAEINSTQGTKNEKGSGLGLILCKELMELQQGSLNLHSQKDKGTKAVLRV